MREERIHAWIFLAISEKPCTLEQIIGTADAINHAVPTYKELRHSLGWLKSNGFIARAGKTWHYSDTGKALRTRVSKEKGSIFTTWEHVESEFLTLTNVYAGEEEISEKEVDESYKKYEQWFWETYNKIKNK